LAQADSPLAALTLVSILSTLAFLAVDAGT
jgi:hypothetical protein